MHCNGERMLQLALEFGRAHWSRQTGLVHYCPGALPGEPHHAAPLYENALYALALLRDRAEGGARLLERLLAWQDEETGGFPAQLHEFPHAFDPFIAERLGPAFLEILRTFGSSLGEPLQGRLRRAVQALLEFGKRRPLQLDTPRRMGQALILYEHGLLDQPLDVALLAKRYHAQTGCFIGLGSMRGSEPEVTPYECLMSLRFGQMPKRAGRPCSAHLEALLARHTLKEIGDPCLDRYGIALCDRQRAPLFAVFGDLSCAHTLQVETTGQCNSHRSNGVVTLQITLPEQLPELDGEKAFETKIFLSLQRGLVALSNGRKVTLFDAQEALSLCYPNHTITLKFEVAQGSGRFIGRVARSNRLGQIAKPVGLCCITREIVSNRHSPLSCRQTPGPTPEEYVPSVCLQPKGKARSDPEFPSYATQPPVEETVFDLMVGLQTIRREKKCAISLLISFN